MALSFLIEPNCRKFVLGQKLLSQKSQAPKKIGASFLSEKRGNEKKSFKNVKMKKNKTIKFFDWRLKVKAYDLF